MLSFARLTASAVAKQELTENKPGYFFVPRFFPEAESLRAQFDWKVALSRVRGKNVLEEIAEQGICRMWSATADRIFMQDAITGFLSHLRGWSKDTVGVNRASSPQIQVFSRDCWRGANQDSTPAKWRYLYVLGPKSGEGSGHATLVPLRVKEGRFFSITRTISTELRYGALLVHEADFGLSIDHTRNASNDPLCGIILLTGYLW